MKQSDNEKMGKIKKFFRLYMFPVVLSVAIIGAVVFGSYDTARATGMEEFFYYTYFDLISGLFAETGQQFSLKDEFYTKPDRVSGKQVWNNFCTWVEEKAKTLALPVEVVNKTVFDELKDLPSKVTSAGATMSEKLSELLAKVLPTFVSDTSGGGFSEIKSFEAAAAIIAAVCGTSAKDVPEYGYFSNGYMLDIFTDGKVIYITEFDCTVELRDGYYEYSDGSGSGACYGIKFSDGLYYSSEKIYPMSSYSWIVHNGVFAGADGTSLNDYANVKTLHDGSVWVPGEGFKDSWAVWDAIKDNVTTDEEETAWNSRYNFDKDNKDDKEKKKKDNEKDKLPVAIPIVFPNKKPDSTEKDSEKDTESDSKKNPMINPDTGRYIDPDTGYDIDPDTGKLIDPDTGELIDPNIPSIADKAGNWKRLFPFCIPWDMMELVKTLKADKKAPRFTFKYTFEKINYTWVVDVNMADYWKYIKIFRWGMTIFFIIGLFFLTAKITTFVHRMSG